MIIGTIGAGAPGHGRGAGVVSAGEVDDAGGNDGTGWAPSAGVGVADLVTWTVTRRSGNGSLMALFPTAAGARRAGSATAGEADGLAAGLAGSADDAGG
jgi:hypothetical protein